MRHGMWRVVVFRGRQIRKWIVRPLVFFKLVRRPINTVRLSLSLRIRGVACSSDGVPRCIFSEVSGPTNKDGKGIYLPVVNETSGLKRMVSGFPAIKRSVLAREY